MFGPLPGPSVRNTSALGACSLISFKSLLINCLLCECFSDLTNQKCNSPPAPKAPSLIYFSTDSYHFLKLKVLQLFISFIVFPSLLEYSLLSSYTLMSPGTQKSEW